jgi:hypothetical protein
LNPKIESPEVFQKLLGFVPEPFPATETDMMKIVWQELTGKSERYGKIPLVIVDSLLRKGVKTDPGTPETVVDLARALSTPEAATLLGGRPASFLLGSSQPHVARQAMDFVGKMVRAGYPLERVDAVGYAPSQTPALELLGNELAKYVHAVFELRGAPLGFPELYPPAITLESASFFAGRTK